MPELPEVETTRRGVEPLVAGRTVAGLVLRVDKLRWPLSPRLEVDLTGQTVRVVERRAKYLLLRCRSGTLIIHLGMTGHLRVVPATQPPDRHDHIDLVFTDGSCLRFSDSRRFGAFLWTDGEPLQHPLLAALGPEPLGEALRGDYLFRQSRGRRGAVKSFIMDQRVLVGVGNIYASEALFRAGIHPGRTAGRISAARYGRLSRAIRQVLEEAIEAGGTTIRDFSGSDGRPGYFSLRLLVYGRAGEPCSTCGRPVRRQVIGGRSTFWCAACQR